MLREFDTILNFFHFLLNIFRKKIDNLQFDVFELGKTENVT